MAGPHKIPAMQGTDATTGQALSGMDHLRQSIRDILTTPLGSRVMRRAYGSNLFSLIDAPMNRQTLLQLYAATADALQTWEPRFQLQQVQAAQPVPGQVTLDVYGLYLPDGQAIKITGIQVGNTGATTSRAGSQLDTNFTLNASTLG